MGCYTVPVIAAGIHYVMRKKNPDWKGDKYHKMLNLLFAGGAVFGVVDHAWNKELFVFSFSDVLLGVVITVSMVLAASAFMLIDKYRTSAQNVKRETQSF